MRLKSLTLYLLFCWPLQAATEDDFKQKSILVLYGTVFVGAWEQTFITALGNKIDSELNPNLLVEFLKLNDIEDDQLSILAESVTLKYHLTPPALVVCVQPSACNFLQEFGEQFAPNAERLYVLPNNQTLKNVQSSGKGYVIPSAWEEAIGQTYLSIPRLLPKVEKIYVISGDGTNDVAYLKRTRSTLEKLAITGLIDIDYSIGETQEDLITKINSSSERNAAILVSTYGHNRRNENYRTIDLTRELRKSIDLPIFGSFDSILGHGTVGGRLSSSKFYGNKAGSLTNSIIQNKKPTKDTTEVTAFIFDDAELRHFGIDKELLPAGSQLVNLSPTVWEEYWQAIMFSFLIIIIQAITIISLYRALRYKQIAEQERDRQIIKHDNQSKMFESVINGIQDAVIITDVNELVVSANRNGLKNTFGYSQEQVLGKPLSYLASISAESPKEIMSQLSTKPTIYTFHDAYGKSFNGESIGTTITDTQGNIAGYYLFVRDVTERLAKEDELRQAHKMEALGNLAGGIAHDFNNILMVIIGNTEIARIDSDNTLELENSLDRVLRAGQRAKDLVSQILTFSRKSEDQTYIRINLSHALHDSIDLLQSSIPSNIEFITKIQDDLWDIKADKLQIQQLIMNLCTNAHHSMAEGGRLKITAQNQRFNNPIKVRNLELPGGDYVIVSVTDTGHGIEPETIRRIFEPFFTTKPPGAGTGMGLALVYGIMESLEAAIEVQSELGIGTTFSCFFQALEVDASELPTSDKNFEFDGQGEYIMLIDDEDMIAETSTRILIMLGYRVDTFTNPQIALNSFRQNPTKYDLILTDQMMPGMDGLSLANKFRELQPKLPVIICTGNRNALKNSSSANSEHVIIDKPYVISELAALLRETLEPKTVTTH